MKTIDIILIGAGARGLGTYSEYAERFPHKLKYVGVAEPDEERRAEFAKIHSIPEERCFASWEELLAQPLLAEAAFIVTGDRLHFSPTVAMLRKGYHVIVEKPMAVDPAECILMVEEAKRSKRILSIGHVLRFTPFFSEIKRIVDSGDLGELVNVNQVECVGFWHFAHSYVRTKWARMADSCPSILAKCCHDLDIIRWLVGAPASRVSSFGNLFQFRPEKAPGNVPERCTDGCEFEEDCPYSVFRLYIDPGRFWVARTLKNKNACVKERIEFLKKSPYSKCVFRADNDVCDQQIVMMQFKNNATATLTMMAHTRDDTRKIRISFTGGELIGDFVGNRIEVRDFLTDKLTVLTPEVIESGHLGGDIVLIDRFLDALHGRRDTHLSSADESLDSHLMAFAAEKSRLNEMVVDMDEFARDIGELAKERCQEL